MLTPCNPCSCPGAPCEHCMFGYNSAEKNHEIMKNLIKETLDEGKPKTYGRSIVELYINNHKDWEKEIEDPSIDGAKLEPEIKSVKEELGSIQTGVMVKCGRCSLEKFFANYHERNDAKFQVAQAGWKTIDDRCVCPDCAAEYEDSMKLFWNAFWDK